MEETTHEHEDELVCQELVELVTLYLEGGLDAHERARFEAHLAVCGHCRIFLEQIRQTIWLAGRLEPPALQPEQRAQLLALFGGLRPL